MKRIALAVATLGFVLGVSGAAQAGGAESQASYETRIDALGREVPAETNWIASGFSGQAWPAHKAVNAQLPEGTQLNSLGQLVPIQTTWPSRFASDTGTAPSGAQQGAAGYSAPESKDAHLPLAPFNW